MLLILAVKTMVLGGIMTPIAFAILGTSILFGCYNLSVAKNPEESENLFNATLMGFALMETFVFTSMLVGYIIYIL
jgi:F0F1-type ATP synthase membrane subunit c/vacuolar-type H+-ATPase subunit K